MIGRDAWKNYRGFIAVAPAGRGLAISDLAPTPGAQVAVLFREPGLRMALEPASASLSPTISAAVMDSSGRVVIAGQYHGSGKLAGMDLPETRGKHSPLFLLNLGPEFLSPPPKP